MNITFSIKPKIGKERMIQFRGVYHIKYDSLYKKLSFKVVDDYKAIPEDAAKDYNSSCAPYCKTFYDVTSMVID